MKKLLILFLLVATFTATAQNPYRFFKFVDEEYTQVGYWIDPTFTDKGAQHGIEIQKIMLWGFAGVQVSVYPELNASYTDYVGFGGINFHLLGYDPIRYYAGPRLGLIRREGNPYPMVGGVMGMDWRLTRKSSKVHVHIGGRLWIDYREDQKDGFFGDSDAYKPGLITNNSLLQENGAFVLSFSWD